MSLTESQKLYNERHKRIIEDIKKFFEWLKENPDHDIEINMWSRHEAMLNPKGTPLESWLAEGDKEVFLDYNLVLEAIGLIKGDLYE